LHTQHHLASKLKARAESLAAIQAGLDGLAAEFGG
ncbi:enoyl-CoA hydratase, partial [Mycobacterium sp. CBMA361]|nr:enoyl-CoA hydratase [Mycolicibacterium sp. CBMA 361]